MDDLKCPHCGKQPDDAIKLSLDGCKPGQGYGVLTYCDHCRGEIEIGVSKQAHVQRRGKGFSDLELDQREAFGG